MNNNCIIIDFLTLFGYLLRHFTLYFELFNILSDLLLGRYIRYFSIEM